MADETKVNALTWAKFIVATLLCGSMLYIHAFIKDLPLLLMALPFALMGLDVSKVIQIGGKK